MDLTNSVEYVEKLSRMGHSNWQSTYDYFQIIIAAGAAAGIIYKISEFVVKKIKKEYNNLTRLHTMVETIYSEITPNHGSSIKDKVVAIESKLEENTKMTKQISHRQRWILDNRDEPIFESDPLGNCTWVNDKYCRLSGHDIGFFLGNGWRNIVHEDDRERIVSEWNSAITDKRDSHISFRLVDRDGKIYNVHSIAIRNAESGYIGNINIEQNSTH